VGQLLVLLLAGVDKIPQDFFESPTGRREPIGSSSGISRCLLLWDVISIGMVLWSIYAVKIFEFPFSFTGWSQTRVVHGRRIFVHPRFGQRQPIYRLGTQRRWRDAAAGGDLHRPRHSLADAPRNRLSIKGRSL